MSLYYEDFQVGRSFTTRQRSVTREDIDGFARLTGDMSRLHTDDEYAKRLRFRGQIAHGLLVVSIAVGLWYDLALTRASIVSLLGVKDVVFRAPVYPGDSITLLSEVTARRSSRSKPSAGIVTLKDRVTNQRGETVLEFERALFLKKKEEEGETRAP